MGDIGLESSTWLDGSWVDCSFGMVVYVCSDATGSIESDPCNHAHMVSIKVMRITLVALLLIGTVFLLRAGYEYIPVALAEHRSPVGM